jgi:hypothetical protein
MLFNSRGQYDPSGDDGDEYHMEYSLDYPKETTYLQCQGCMTYVHSSKGIIDLKLNEFFCNECDKQYQENHKND